AMDCQTGLVHIYAKPMDEFVARTARVAHTARQAGMPVIHVQVGFRAGLPEVSDRNMLFATIKSSAERRKLFEGDAGAIHPALGPEPTDIVVTKRRVSAFAGTDLEMILRAGGIDTLALFGIATSGVVLSTLVDAFDADYRIAVIADCCADLDIELHQALIARLFPKRGRVITAEQFIAAIARDPGS